MAHDVFISYNRADKLVADAACARLEARGIRCWIAPRDVVPGQRYGEAINTAIKESKALVLVFSSNSNVSEHVSSEVGSAFNFSVPIVPLRIENVEPTNSLEFFTRSFHWLDAWTPPMEAHLDYLATSVDRLIGRSRPTTQPPPGDPPPTSVAPPQRPPVRLYAAVAGLLVLLVAVVGYWAFMRETAQPAGDAPVAINAVDSRGNPVANDQAEPNASGAPANPTPASPGTLSRADTGNGREVSARRANPGGIVGCWLHNGVRMQFAPGGRIVGGGDDVGWQSDGEDGYTIRGPLLVDTFEISEGGQTLNGFNNYGPAVSARRLSAAAGPRNFAGTWMWNNGLTVLATTDGSVRVGATEGRWIVLDGATVRLTWKFGFFDSVKLSADGLTLAGTNNIGLAVGGTRIACADGG